ncbi:MAG TPA: Bax inhibitor-1/YccA family protein [Gemmatimonadaceae bacterium]|nr:Bax inhibitor-1/YccA family protein [Gemmatimonadaceae bacterium]
MTTPSFAHAIPVRSGAERATLVRRTYSVVFLGIIVTCVGAAFAMSQPSLMAAVQEHPIITMIAVFAPLILVMRNPRQFPQNVALTGLFAFAEGVWLAPLLFVAERTQPGIINQAALLTLGTFGALTAYAVFSRRDFSAWGSFFMIGLVILLITSILNIFFRSSAAALYISAATVFVFGGLLVFDTWRIVRSGQYGEDDYVAAAVQIYLDLLNMFLAILSLLGGRRR